MPLSSTVSVHNLLHNLISLLNGFRPYTCCRNSHDACDVLCRRRTYRPDAITWTEIEPEAETGKQIRLLVKDKEGRAVLLMRPRSAHKLSYPCHSNLTERLCVLRLPWIMCLENAVDVSQPASSSLLLLHFVITHGPTVHPQL